MKVLLWILICGIYLCLNVVRASKEGEIDKNFPTRRKASLFLQSNAIPAINDVIPEEIAPKAQEYLPLIDEEDVLTDPYEKHAVLTGNYPESELKEDVPINDGPVVGQKLLMQKLLLLDPVEQLLLNSSAVISNATDNETASGAETAADVDNELLQPASYKEGLGSFVKRLLECKTKLIFCNRKRIVSCYLHCLLSKHPIGQVVKSNVDSLVKTLCLPLGTTFDATVRVFHKQFENIKSIRHFLVLLGVVPHAFKRFTRLAANAIPSLILKYTNVEGTDLFSGVLSTLESDAKEADRKEDNEEFKDTDITSELSNPGCLALDKFRAVQQIVSILYKNPKVVDIFLPGLWTISKMFHMINVPHLKSSLKAFGGALSILLGANCGLVHYIQTGSNATCEEDEHVAWEAGEGESIPPEKGRPEICGAVPHIPPFFWGQDMFPPIFEIKEEKPSNHAGNETDISLSENDSNSTQDTDWKAEVMKSLDEDDDER